MAKSTKSNATGRLTQILGAVVAGDDLLHPHSRVTFAVVPKLD